MAACTVPASRFPAPGPAFPLAADWACIPLAGQPLLQGVPAGFPSPAANFAEERLNLETHLVRQKDATYYVRVQGHSMEGFGIHDGDLLVVDRSLEALDQDVVIAVVDGAFTVKQFHRLPEGVLLRAGNPGHRDILVSGEQSLSVWGVVCWSIHSTQSPRRQRVPQP